MRQSGGMMSMRAFAIAGLSAVCLSVCMKGQALAQNNPFQTNQVGPGQKIVGYTGYADAYQPVRDVLAAGNVAQAREQFISYFGVPETEDERGNTFGVDDRLRRLEIGSFDLDAGNLSASVELFSAAEDLFDKRQNRGWFRRNFEKAKEWTGRTVLGMGNLGEYEGAPYEHVLALNLETLAYLVQGERSAINVARRAIDLQEVERDEFLQELADANEELEDLAEKEDERSFSIARELSDQYTVYDDVALRVPSAFVNPLGYYVSGMVREIESFNRRSRMDNARISYEKVLELAPDVTSVEEAVAQLRNRELPENRKLVHVIVSDGLAPDRQTLTYGLLIGQAVLPVSVPIMVPVDNPVARIEVRDGRGRLLDTLEPLADIEALVMRYQKDSLPIQDAKVVAAVAGIIARRVMLDNLGPLGALGALGLESLASPDTRYWGSLPARYQVARFFVAPNTPSVHLQTYDARGRKLAEQTVDLGEASHNVIYGRALGNSLAAQTNSKIWVD